MQDIQRRNSETGEVISSKDFTDAETVMAHKMIQRIDPEGDAEASVKRNLIDLFR